VPPPIVGVVVIVAVVVATAVVVAAAVAVEVCRVIDNVCGNGQ